MTQIDNIRTYAYRTRTMIRPRKHPSIEQAWGIAIDVGYSAVKIFAPNIYACFPSYARKIDKKTEFLGEADHDCILYENEEGERWIVGAYAQSMIEKNEASSSLSGLVVRDRFYSPMFKVIARTGIALGMTANRFGSPQGKVLTVQTGLPPRHMGEYKQDLSTVLSGEHRFRIKIGSAEWQDVNITLPEDNIYVMPQPLGSFVAVSTDSNGGIVPEGREYILSTALVCDPGYGTADTFNITGRRITGNATWEDLGMYRVLSDTCSDIYDLYRTEITVPAMQKYLESGCIRVTDRRARTTKEVSFSDILVKNSEKVCDELLRTMDEAYDGLFNHDYLIVTGGLGAAWYDRIKEYYSGVETLKVIPGTQNDTIEGIFSNVRGYYMNLLSTMKKKYK